MSLVFGAITPHPPLLIPAIGKDNISKVEKTVKALKDLEGELYNMQPDTIIILSPHSPIAANTFSVNLAPKFHGHMEEFGDFDTKLEISCDTQLISSLKENTDSNNIPLQTISQENFDHGVTVPLFYLAQHLPKVKVVPISLSMLDYKTHYEFGKILRKTALECNKRIAIIASGDLSHRLTSDAPAGYAPEAETFDQALIKLIEDKNTEDILALDPKVIETAGECGLRSIIVLLGALNDSSYDVKTLSYEGPFGVGYLTAQFMLK